MNDDEIEARLAKLEALTKALKTSQPFEYVTRSVIYGIGPSARKVSKLYRVENGVETFVRDLT